MEINPVYMGHVPDPKRAARIVAATRELLKECDGEPYDVRLRFGVLIPTLRGHRVLAVEMKEDPAGSVGQCERCGQIVKVLRDGRAVTGHAIENDCPSAEWLRP